MFNHPRDSLFLYRDIQDHCEMNYLIFHETAREGEFAIF